MVSLVQVAELACKMRGEFSVRSELFKNKLMEALETFETYYSFRLNCSKLNVFTLNRSTSDRKVFYTLRLNCRGRHRVGYLQTKLHALVAEYRKTFCSDLGRSFIGAGFEPVLPVLLCDYATITTNPMINLRGLSRGNVSYYEF